MAAFSPVREPSPETGHNSEIPALVDILFARRIVSTKTGSAHFVSAR
jgi:hypothetical protein